MYTAVLQHIAESRALFEFIPCHNLLLYYLYHWSLTQYQDDNRYRVISHTGLERIIEGIGSTAYTEVGVLALYNLSRDYSEFPPYSIKHLLYSKQKKLFLFLLGYSRDPALDSTLNKSSQFSRKTFHSWATLLLESRTRL